MKVANVMTSNVRIISADQTIGEAEALMSKEDIGALPVGEQDHLVGMITDRDIAIRGVGQGAALPYLSASGSAPGAFWSAVAR
jgi:CBS domain-containing protein